MIYRSILVLAVACSTFASGCGGPDASAAGKPQGGGEGPPPALVRIVTIKEGMVPPRVVAVGSVMPVDVSVAASGANGVVENFLVNEGDYVVDDAPLSELRMLTTNLEIAEHKSQLDERKHMLAEFEAGSRSEDLAEAEAKMKSALASARYAKNRLDRMRKLEGRGAVNDVDMDDALESFEAAQQALEAAVAMNKKVKAGPRTEQIAQARARYAMQQKHVEFLEAEREKRTTRAPFAGFVTAEHTFRGQWLSKGDPVVTIARMDEVDVLVNVDQRDLKHVRVGDDAAVEIAGASPVEWSGKIVAVVPRSEWKSGSRAFPVKIRLTNSFEERDGRKSPVLKEGMMATVTFRGPPQQALMVHKDALVRTTSGVNVHVFLPETEYDPQTQTKGSAVQVPVDVGVAEGEMIQIIPRAAPSGGPPGPPGVEKPEVKLADGVLVVSEGAERLQPVQANVVTTPTAAQ